MKKIIEFCNIFLQVRWHNLNGRRFFTPYNNKVRFLETNFPANIINKAIFQPFQIFQKIQIMGRDK